MNVIAGIGWIAQREYGCVATGLRRTYPDMRSLRSDLEDESVLLYPVKSFGKYDLVSKMTCCVSALALYDAGIPYSESQKQDIGILGTNTDGCLQSNVEFFKDYVEHGRTLGRASLFVNTLPSIPMAEAAIYFKCRGPLVYMAFPQRQVPSLLSQSEKMILRGESAMILAVKASEQDALCFVVAREKDVSAQKVFGVEEVMGVAEKIPALDEMIRTFTSMAQDDDGRGLQRMDPHERGRV
jgi:hypothetical protein